MDPNDFEDLMRHQNMMFRSVAMEQETDGQIKLLDIINNMGAARKKVQKAAVILEAEQEGMSEEDILRHLNTLKRDNLIIEPEPGYIKRI
jgi:hypothetical protein